MAKQQRDMAKESQWRETLQRYSASGLSVREFCRQEKLTKSNFYAWRRTLDERNGKPAPAFVPAVVADKPACDASITIELAGTCVLRLPESIAATKIAELVHALETRGER